MGTKAPYDNCLSTLLCSDHGKTNKPKAGLTAIMVVGPPPIQKTKIPAPRVTGTNRAVRGYLFRNLRGQVRRPETPSGFRIEQAWSTPAQTRTKSPDRTTMKLLVLKTASITPKSPNPKTRMHHDSISWARSKRGG